MFKFILVLSLLTGCTSLVPQTLRTLNDVDPLRADPAGFAVAVHIPDGLVLPGPKLTVRTTRADTGETANGSFTLIPMDATGDVPPAPEQSTLQAFRIDPDELDTMRHVQETALVWEDTVPDVSDGSISVEVAACRIGLGPDPKARGSVFLRIARNGPFLPVLKNAPLAKLMAQPSANPDVPPPDCP